MAKEVVRKITAKCWNCEGSTLTEKVDKEHSKMVYYVCDNCGASVVPQQKSICRYHTLYRRRK